MFQLKMKVGTVMNFYQAFKSHFKLKNLSQITERIIFFQINVNKFLLLLNITKHNYNDFIYYIRNIYDKNILILVI